MKKSLVLLAIASLFSVALAATQHAPLSPKILAAKKIYIDNRSGYADIGDRAYDELKKWGRFQIVASAKDADLVFLISAKVYTSGSYTQGHIDDSGNYSGTSTATTTGYTYLTVIDPNGGESLWSDSHRWGSLLIPRSAVRQLIKGLRKRIEEQKS